MAHSVEILLEDADLLAVNKPAGMLTIPDRQGAESLRELLARQKQVLLNFRERTHEGKTGLRIVHRLDRETSGVLVLAKHVEAQRTLSGQFFRREVEKSYLAIVRGSPAEDEGLVDVPLGPDPRTPGRMRVRPKAGKRSQTRWAVLERFRGISLLRCRPLTGRQHQIRVHMAHAGMPLLVDPLYGSAEAFFLSSVKRGYRRGLDQEERPLIARLTLHAESLRFVHPISGEPVCVEAPPPKDFRATLAQLRKTCAP